MASGKSKITIGNAGGYWGDDTTALRRQVLGGHLDYISIDFLAEITMSIMQKQRARNPASGFAGDMLPMLEEVFATMMQRKTVLITNAGGVNPEGCAEAIIQLAQKLGLRPRVGVVYGDDIMNSIPDLQARGAKLANMETGESFDTIANRVQAANIYFGAWPVVDALSKQPDIIVTGRVTDTGITLAPMIHEFGWAANDWDKISAGIVAGHLLECGAQSTGGNFTDWRKVKSFKNIGYPIVEVNSDASFVLTKHANTGGMVSVDTAREQLFYEMGNPRCYLTPDVVADFSTIQLKPQGEDRVHVSGIKGFEPTPLYKVSMAYTDGFKILGQILISGPDAREKAELFSNIFWERCADLQLTERSTEFVGLNACHRSLSHRTETGEIVLKLGARATTEAPLKKFSKIIPALILSGPAGVAVLGGAPKPAEVVSYWPALMQKELVSPKILIRDASTEERFMSTRTPTAKFTDPAVESQKAESATEGVAAIAAAETDPAMNLLRRICLARSGDKGDTCNVGVMARSPEAFAFLREHLTAQVVKNMFQELCHGPVVRYTVANMDGFNFLLERALGGGGTMTLRSDAQGKTFAQALLNQRMRIPKSVLDSCERG